MSTELSDRIKQIAWNSNLATVAANLELASDLVAADDALAEGERQIDAEARMALAIATKGEGKTHWSTIGRALNALDERLPDPPVEIDGAA